MGQLKMREPSKGPFINAYGPGLQLKLISPTENKQMGMGQLEMGKQNKGSFINTYEPGLQLKPTSPTGPT